MSRILLYRPKTVELLAKRNQDHYQNRPIQVQIERVDLVTHPFNLEYITYKRNARPLPGVVNHYAKKKYSISAWKYFAHMNMALR